VSPSQRDREYARRRYAEWQARQAERARQRRRRLTLLAIIGSVLVVGAIIAGVFALAAGRDDDPQVAATDADASATSEPAEDPDNPCPAPTVEPPAEPLTFEAPPDPSVAENRVWTSVLATSCGDITVELFGDRAPKAVASFVQLARDGYFTGVPCHRLTTEGIFVLQCGDPTGTGQGGPGYNFGPVENAPADDSYPAGTLAMARVGDDANSQGSQFFLVYDDSAIPSDTAGGYSVFGRITSGLEIVQQVADGGLAEDGTAPARAISLDEVTVQ
jgi:peptidyl-prolyl cis-trans isomerase B (cyclophilin B)